jgi:MerR family copper efflux transcriptional regulator
MRIKAFEAATGLSRTTVRFYEAAGLIVPDEDAAGNGYRSYGPAHVERARMVRLAQSLGFSIREIGALARAWDDGLLDDDAQRRVLAGKLGEVREKRRRLAALEDYLSRKIAWIDGGRRGPSPDLPGASEPGRPEEGRDDRKGRRRGEARVAARPPAGRLARPRP